MLYIFQVDTGSMIIFDMSVALESVANLKQVIAKNCKIPEDKQVLLISGGYSLDPSTRVCTYSAGTDTSPIFLFSKITIESDAPPLQSGESQIGEDMSEKVEGCLNMPPTYNTIVTRSQLAQQFYELAQAQKCRFECLVHEQHLQQQGWAAVVANLEDIISVFKSRAEGFEEKFKVFLETRDYNLELLKNFSRDLQLLSRIPVLPALLRNSSSASGVENSTAVSLLQWISSKDNQNSLEQIANNCLKGLEQFDDEMLKELRAEVHGSLQAVGSSEMKEIKGLEDRLFGLEKLMDKARGIVEEQGCQAQALLQNQTNAGNQDDPSVLPDLCASHVCQMKLMLENHRQLRDIHQRFLHAKNELSCNLHIRLKWIMYVEETMHVTDSKLGFHHENLKRLKRHLEVVQQIHLAPRVYLEATQEVARRNTFSKAFLQWAGSLSQVSSQLHHQEIEARRVFNVQITNHFLQTLFPGMDDNPPPFATQPPAEFDTCLPAIKYEDVEALRRNLPELSELLSSSPTECVPSFPAIPPGDCKTSSSTQTLKSDGLAMSDEPSSQETLKDVKSREAFSTIAEEMDQEKKETSTPLLKAVSEPGGSSHGDPTEVSSLARAHSDGDIKVAASHDFLTADFFIDESMPSSYTDSNGVVRSGHMVKSHHSVVAELQRQLDEKQTQLRTAQEEVSTSQSQVSHMKGKLFELQEWVHQLLKKDVVFVKDKILRDRCEFGALAEKIGDAVQRLQCQFEHDKQAAVAQAVEDERREQLVLLQRLEIEVHKLSDTERELEIYQQKLKEQSWLLDSLKQDSQVQSRYLEAEKELVKKMTLEHELELDLQRQEFQKSQEEIQCLKESLGDKSREMRLFWERNQELGRTVEDLQARLLAKEKSLEEELDRLLKEREPEWELEKQKQMRELQENLERAHKSEVQSLRYRFKLAYSTTAMERSPSDSSLENIHMEKDVADVQQQMEEEKKSVAMATEEEAKRWQEMIGRIREEHQEQMNNLKLATEADKKAAVSDALAQLTTQKDKTIEELRRTETQLMHQHAQDRETMERLLRGQTDSSSEMRDALSISMQREREAREAHFHVESELLDSQHKLSEHLKKQVDLTLSVSSVMETSVLADQQMSQLKCKLYEKEAQLQQLRQKMMELSVAPFAQSIMQSDKVSVLSCNVGDVVLLTYDDKHENYVVFILGSTLHFLHTDCLEPLALQSSPVDTRTAWALAEVTGKEYCQARKSNNRYKVPIGKRFYRVKAKPWDREGALQREQQRRATPSLLAKSMATF